MASFSISLGGGSKSRKPSPPPARNGVKRAHASLDDADSDDEDMDNGKRQSITHFNIAAGGAVDATKPKIVKEALVIKPQANRDWKEASLRNKRQKYGIPSEDAQKAKENFVAPQPSTTFGLNVHKPDEHFEDSEMLDQASQHATETPTAKPKSEDERAIAALMGLKEESTLTIPAVTEDEAFERDVKEAPDAPTLAEYAAVPVEEFGAAMLRGMGWKEGQGIGSQQGRKIVKAKVPERRPALLGIGAKPDAAVAAELGAWGAGAKGKRRPDIIYNPLVLKNSKTGDRLTEDELKLRLLEQKERDANERYPRDTRRDYERRDDKSSTRHRHAEDDNDERDERRRRERRKERADENDRRRSRRDRSDSVERRSSMKDDKYRDRDYDRKSGHRSDRDSRRGNRDDYRERRRDRSRDGDDRSRRSRY